MSIRVWYRRRKFVQQQKEFEQRQEVINADLFATLLDNQGEISHPPAPCCKTCGIPIAHPHYVQRVGDAPDPYCAVHTPRSHTEITLTTQRIIA